MKILRLGEMLVQNDVLTQEELDDALSKQRGSGKRLGTVLIDEGYITEKQLITTLKTQLGIDEVDLNEMTIPPEMATYIPKSVAVNNRIVPVKLEGDRLFIAMEDPLNFRAIEEAKEVSRKKITPMITYSAMITRALSVVYENEGAANAIKEMREERGLTIGEMAAEQEAQDENAAAPTVKLVNSILERAITDKASDIHIEPTNGKMRIRIRVDGRLVEIPIDIPKEFQSNVISRIKVMGDMNITERRIPQDGRALFHTKTGEDIDLRINTLPTIYGEKIVIRILWRDATQLNRRAIGITEKDNAKFDRVLKNSSGMILVVGPTGSGKTSTLYTMIKELNKTEINMISLEDPVEFQIEGVTQVPINEKVGLTFASALRSCLRQDPDVICVGEIRDGETAEIALRAAMTGHLVLSTIHTEDAVSAIDRLKDLGVEPYLVAGSVRGIISQRLVRRICPNCKKEITPDPYLLDLAGIKNLEGRKFYKGTGCHMCMNSGYKGRIGVFEIFTMNGKLRDAIAAGASGTDLRNALEGSKDFTPMIVNARDLVQEGVTTLDEVLRTVATIE